MAKQLAASTINAMMAYIEDGVPMKDLDMSDANRERLKVAEQVYERLQQDPMLDINRCLMRAYGRSKQQAALDKQVVELFVSAMDEPSRKIMTYRARKIAERLVKIGEQTGDAKWIDKGLTQIIKLDRLNEEEVQQEDVRNTASLPPVIVGIEIVNPERESIDDKRFKELINKYGGKEDDFSKMVAVRARRLQGEDMNMLAQGAEDDE